MSIREAQSPASSVSSTNGTALKGFTMGPAWLAHFGTILRDSVRELRMFSAAPVENSRFDGKPFDIANS
ncbi:MAG: hypothetical protein NTV34_19525, partial [Proteobacteria bacterium]|nr:hypothetical protein [Pseudomonadota bacterium]